EINVARAVVRHRERERSQCVRRARPEHRSVLRVDDLDVDESRREEGLDAGESGLIELAVAVVHGSARGPVRARGGRRERREHHDEEQAPGAAHLASSGPAAGYSTAPLRIVGALPGLPTTTPTPSLISRPSALASR